MIENSYSQLMGEQTPFITLQIDTDEPIELADFVGAFTSLANEFERFVSITYPEAKSDPRMYVREVRHGSVEADIITGLTGLAAYAANSMDQVMILEDFVRRWGARFRSLVTGDILPGQL